MSDEQRQHEWQQHEQPGTPAPVSAAPVTAAPVSAAPVTAMSLRAERMRMRFAQAAGAKVHDPGLSPAPAVRDPALVNRFAVAALAVGIVALFLSTFYIASTATFVLCVLSVRQWRSLQRQGKQPWGRRRTIWAFWFGVFGVAQCSFGLFIVPLFH